ncbi:MAG: XdhC family protein [Anaerolineaceae bacterium]|nr:XdhC family protein [Anaerolineaceae bacterium]
MREIAGDIQKWKSQNKAVATATIVKANGSPMRPIGSKMAVTDDQQITGSVTGGCIEGAVYEEAQEVLTSGIPKIVRYGVASDQTPWEVGLSCGSSLDVFIESLQSSAWQQQFSTLQQNLDENQLFAAVTLLNGEDIGAKLLVWPDGRTQGSLGSSELDKAGINAALQQLVTRDPKATKLSDEVEAFIDVYIPPSRLIIVGAVHIAIPMVGLAKALGFRTLVVDPRKPYNNRERFPSADELILEWPSDAIDKMNPDQGTFIAVVSHDDKLDNPALASALKSQAAYVGVLGTKRNVGKRLDALRELGVSEELLKRLHAPIGLDIGAVQPEEIALSVLAEIVAVHHGLERQGEISQKSIL